MDLYRIRVCNIYILTETGTSMATYTTNEFRNGMKLMIDGSPCSIIECDFVKPGKGQAFARVKLRNLISKRVMERTYKSGENVESADVMDTDMQYLYNDGQQWHFMHPESYEQFSADKDAVSDAAKWLKDQDMCTLTLWNNAPIEVIPPNFVELQIVETDPGVRGDTASGGQKPATLETGAVVKVPLFVENNEIIKVDTRTGEYVGRVKT